ncbi:Smc5-6 complex SMC subunit Smc5 [Schizosaccharomyces cryophilus OY26]|uniref:Structural maintenance of chromosomes protein 5 n=1 Tax=Schizosaccharomyces cryophilus (strain OY26 / ATCC MYA-4695 / CBS 11777 / NBRC 106824 / NRRL Y48691) TaxID=653667 RepID=S9VQF8_SCHCR|nr:Smc5-6 complex SMC subunit Smc5 [Schizosaccharomyces cryophilus OY26]EPY50198.1 Smc5-6 complex SMC subunit Smc5 [Schizosaccharomyces cryophilus OY26]
MEGHRPEKRRRNNPNYFTYAYGSIVRVKLINFVTYEYCEFYPGPYLNMIIGPNGTGKSTVVSAICLGLGWSPKLLGRAKEAREYIKYGKNCATIELELKLKDDKTVIITRQINQDKSSSFSINKEACSSSAISHLMEKFNIQLNNLCHFLPQDRVAEFAQLDPFTRLIETERAIDHEGLLLEHEKLIELRKEEKDTLQYKDQGQNTLSSIKERQQALEKEVEIFKERENIQSYLSTLAIAKDLIIYREKTTIYNQLRENKVDIKEKLKHAIEEFRPILSMKEQLQSDLQDKKEAFDQLSSSLAGLKQKVGREKSSVSNFMENEKRIYEKTNSNRVLLKSNQSAVQEAQQALDGLLGMMGPKPSEQNFELVHQKMQELNTEKLRYENEKLESSHALGNIRTFKAQKLLDIDNLRRELNAYNDLTRRKLKYIATTPGWEDAYHTYQLLKENESNLEEAAYGPIYMHLECKKKNVAPLIEGFFRADTFRTFVMSNYSDYLKLMDLITSKTRYTPTVREFSSERCKKLDDFQCICSREKLKSFGFDGYLLDYLEGPEVVLVALCHMLKIHQIPVAEKELSPSSVNALNNYRLPNGDPVFKTYLAGSSVHLVFRSAYGNRELTQRTDPLPSNSVYFSESVEPSLVKEKEEQLSLQTSKLEELQSNERNLQGKVSECDALISEANEKIGDLRKERDEKLTPLREWQDLNDRANHQRLLLEQRKKIPSQLEKELENNKASRKENCMALLNSIKKMKDQNTKATIEFEKSLGSQLNVIEANYRLQKHELDAEQVNNHLRELHDKLQEASGKISTARKDAMEIYNSVVERLQHEDPERQAAITEVSEEFATVSEVENKISVEETKLGFMNVNNFVMEQYDRRKNEIEELEMKMSRLDESVLVIQEKIEDIKKAWLIKLEKVIECITERFSQSMSSMGYAGEVRLGKAEDYDKWRIDIMVQFREAEGLQKLTGQRQSGGERSVSTIMYLLALQGVASAPFRIVDEINQGMDPRNERVVHSHIVNSTCETPSSQYFLVTPKLLPDLTYHRNLKVLCVCNGSWLPDTFRMSLSSYLEGLKNKLLLPAS